MIDKMKVYQDTELSSKAVSVYLYLCERASMLSGKLNDAPSGRLFRADLEFLQRCPSL